MIFKILCLNGQEERPEPFEGAKVSADPEKVDLSETSLSLRIVHSIPDTLQNGCKWCNADTSTDKDSDLELKDILRSTAEGSIDVDSR